MRRLAAVVVLLALPVLAGCTSEQQREQQDLVQPYLNTFARQLAEEPNVSCVVGLLPDGGTGVADSTVISLELTVEDLDDPALPALLREAGRLVWDSPLPVAQLNVAANGTGPSLTGLLRGTTEDYTPVTTDELAQEYGPRASLPPEIPAISDPGRLDC